MTKYKGFQLSWWVCVLCAAMSIGAAYIAAIFPNVFPSFFWMLLGETALVVPMAASMMLSKKLTPYYEMKDIIGFNRFDLRILLIIFFLPLAIQCYASLVSLPVSAMLGRFFSDFNTIEQLRPHNLSEVLLLFLSICVVAPVVEEIIFRGGIIHMLDRYGNVFAVLISALAFAVIHFNPAGFIVMFALGIVLGFVRYTTDSIYPCIIMHAANNLFGFLQIVFISNMSNAFLGISSALTIVFAAAAPVLLIVYCKMMKVKVDFTKAYAKPGISIGLIVTVILYIGLAGFSFYQSGTFQNIQYDIARFRQRLIPDSSHSYRYPDFNDGSRYGYGDMYDFDFDDFFY